MLAFILAAAFAGAAQPVSISGVDLQTGESAKINTEKGIVVAFLSARCPCSNSHIAELAALAKSYPEFQFIGVHSNHDEDLEPTRAYFRKVALPFPILQDNRAILADRFKALKTPHVFVYSGTGEKLYAGGVSDSHDFSQSGHKYLREALDDLSHGRAVRTSEGRTLGCVIQR